MFPFSSANTVLPSAARSDLSSPMLAGIKRSQLVAYVSSTRRTWGKLPIFVGQFLEGAGGPLGRCRSGTLAQKPKRGEHGERQGRAVWFAGDLGRLRDNALAEASSEGDIDRKVLRTLEQDARRTPEQVATLVGHSAERVATAIARLERSGIIRGYRTLVNWDRVAGERVVAFIDVSVSPQRDVGFEQVAARIYRHPEVRSVHLVSGGHDLRIVVEGSTMREVAAFVSEKLAPIDHVTATNTHFLLKAYKENNQVLIEEDTDDDRLAVAP